MNKNEVEGKWEQLKGEIQKSWGNLTNDEVAQFKGDARKFYGALQEKYGLAQKDAETRVKELQKKCGYDSTASAA